MSDDLEAIRRLKASYFRALDSKDWAGLAAVFTDDAEIDMTGEGAGVIHGSSAFVTYLSDVLGTATTVHHGHMPEIELTSPTTATGIWAMEDELWWPAGGPVRHLHGFGHYHETYRKAPGADNGGEWRIATMTLTRLHRQIDS